MSEVLPPLVSVVIPAFNAEAFVLDAVTSALASKGTTVEVIVIDDASTDATVELVSNIEDSRVSLLRSCSRSGAPASRNRGLQKARGDFVQFLDADDVLLPEKIRKCLDVFESDPALSSVFCGAYFFGPEAAEPHGPEYEKMDGSPVIYLLDRPFQTACGLHRTAAVKDVGGFKEQLRRGQEYELHLRMAVSGAAMGYAPERLVGLRVHSSPYRITNVSATADQMGDLMAGLAETAREKALLDDAEKMALANRTLVFGMACHRQGTNQMARRCINAAVMLCPNIDYPHHSGAARAAASVFGIGTVETAVAGLRRAFGMTKGP